MYSEQYTVYSEQYTVDSEQHTVYSEQLPGYSEKLLARAVLSVEEHFTPLRQMATYRGLTSATTITTRRYTSLYYNSLIHFPTFIYTWN